MQEFIVSVDNVGSIVISNKNTTIGYATFDATNSELTYIFVNTMFRRCGYGSILVLIAEKVVGRKLKPAAPISPSGEKFFKGKIKKT